MTAEVARAIEQIRDGSISDFYKGAQKYRNEIKRAMSLWTTVLGIRQGPYRSLAPPVDCVPTGKCQRCIGLRSVHNKRCHVDNVRVARETPIMANVFFGANLIILRYSSLDLAGHGRCGILDHEPFPSC